VPRAEWGIDPDFFGPRHAHREGLILRALRRVGAAAGGLHLECAAGVGSLSISLARAGKRVVAADRSLRSLAVIRSRLSRFGPTAAVLPVATDITRLPFRDGAFATASTAETLEHLENDTAAVGELARVLLAEGTLVGTVPAGPGQWSAWDDWAGHRRRYTQPQMEQVLAAAGLEPWVTTWGWPLVRLYDDLFLKRINRRRMESSGPVGSDPTLRTVSSLGRRRWLVRLLRLAFSVDRWFAGAQGGVGLLFRARKPVVGSRSREPAGPRSTSSPTGR